MKNHLPAYKQTDSHVPKSLHIATLQDRVCLISIGNQMKKRTLVFVPPVCSFHLFYHSKRQKVMTTKAVSLFLCVCV